MSQETLNFYDSITQLEQNLIYLRTLSDNLQERINSLETALTTSQKKTNNLEAALNEAYNLQKSYQASIEKLEAQLTKAYQSLALSENIIKTNELKHIKEIKDIKKTHSQYLFIYRLQGFLFGGSLATIFIIILNCINN
jgi:chromosome segregation ATPase